MVTSPFRTLRTLSFPNPVSATTRLLDSRTPGEKAESALSSSPNVLTPTSSSRALLRTSNERSCLADLTASKVRLDPSSPSLRSSRSSTSTVEASLRLYAFERYR